MIKLDAIINDKKLLTSIQKGVDTFNKSTSGRSKLNLKINEKGFRQPLGRITGDLDKFESALAASNARVIAFGASTAVIGGMTKAFKELALTTINVQKSFADINRILNVSNREFDQFSTQLFNIGKRTATTFEDSSKAALEFARQGLSLNETLKRTADALTLVRLTGVNADKAVSSLTAAVNAFQHTSISTTEVLNKFVAVETKFAVSARDLMEGLGRVGSAAVDAKVNFNELNAMVAAVQQQTGRGGAVIGNALKTIFTRLQRRDTLTALESYGIAVRNIEGQTRPAMAILQDFAKTYDTLADSNKAYLREQVAGVFQANILSAIVKDLNSNTQVYNRALTVSAGATNEADMANARLNKTLSALLSQTGTELIRLQENIGKITFEPIAKGLLGPFKGLIEGINNLVDGEGLGSEIANGLLKGIRNVLAGPGLVGAIAIIGSTVIKTVGFMAKALPTLVGITTQVQKRANLETTISGMLASDAGLTKQIAANEGKAAVQAGILLGAAQKAETAFAAAALTTAAIAKNLAAAGVTTNKAGALVPRGRGAFGRGAEGFIPGAAGELNDIHRGTGGVSSSARPVHLPNFAFAGGARGSMIANTGEHIVPNYRGGGSAIFNPDMVRANGGLPRGAKKITASKGYVPNFAIKPTTALGAGTSLDALTKGIISGQYSAINVGRSYDIQGKTYSASTINEKILAARVSRDAKVKGKKDKKGAKNVFSIPAAELAGGIGAIVGFATRSPAVAATSETGFAQLIAGKKSPNPQLAAYLQKNATGKNKKRIQLTGIPVAALNSLGGTGDEKAKQSIERRFRKKLNKFMLPALNRYTSNIFKDLLKDDGKAFVKKLTENKRNVFSTSVEGGIFESALRLAGRKSKAFKGDDMARFDFEESGTISPALADTFFTGKKVTRADAKRSDTAPNIKTLIAKSVGTLETANSMWEELVKRGASPVTEKAAQGYVPNFAARGTVAARVQKGRRAARNAEQLQITTQSGLTVLVKGIDYKIVGGKARFTAVGEQKAFSAGGLERGGTSLMLADGRMVLSNKPLHGMAAMQAGIPASKIESLVVGGGFHNVNTGRLTYTESDFVQSNRLQQVAGGAGGYVPNFARTSLARKLGGRPSTSKKVVDKILKKFGISKSYVASKKMVGKMKDTGYSLLAKGGDNKIVQALNYLVRSFTVGSAKGLPIAAFVADAIAKYGLVIIRRVMAIVKNLQAGNSALKGVQWKEQFGSTAQGGLPGFASGYVPNFGGLGAAISREKGAGIPSSAIRISSSPRFQNAQNPAGLAVTNTLDEPRGLADVPNFAESVRQMAQWGGGLTTTIGAKEGGSKKVLAEKEKQLARQLDKTLRDYKKGKISRDKLNKTREKLTSTMKLTDAAEKRVEKSVTRRANAVDKMNARGGVGLMGGKGAKAGGPGGGMGGIMAMMLVPMAGGMAEQAVGGQGGAAISGAATGGMMGGLLGGMTGAAMATAGVGGGFMAPTIMGAKVGGVGGPAGVAVGVAIGATIGAIIAWNSAAESATDKLQAFTAELNASLSGANAYAAGRKAMDDATTMEQFEIAANAASNALMAIDDPGLRRALIENKNEFQELTKVIREYKEEEMKRIVLQKGIAQITEMFPKQELFTSKAFLEAAGIKEGTFRYSFPEGMGPDPEGAGKIQRSLEQKSFNQLLQYFRMIGTTLPEMEKIQKALAGGEHGYLGKTVGGGSSCARTNFQQFKGAYENR